MHILTAGQLWLLLALHLLAAVTFSGAATQRIVHSPASAVSHQSFVRLQQSSPLILAKATAMAIATAPVPQPSRVREAQPGHTPAHRTYAARPVVHQMLPSIKPVRIISYASLRHTQPKFV